MLLEFIGILVLSCVIWQLANLWLAPRNLPPGIRTFSFQDILSRSRGPPPHETLMRMAREYGDVSSITQGRRVTILINSFSAAKEALREKGNDLAGRPTSQAGSMVANGRKSIVLGDPGGTWVMHRKSARSAISAYCAQRTLEEKVTKGADNLIKRFQDAMKEPFDPKYKVYLAVVNVMCAIVFGETYELNDPEFYEIVELNNRLSRIAMKGEILDKFPLLKYFPTELMNDILEATGFRNRLCKRKLQDHRRTIKEGSIRDLTDAWLNLIDDADNKNIQFDKEHPITDDNLIATIMDFVSTGSDKTSAVICWALVYITNHPAAQLRVHRELDNVVGRERLPNLSDKSSLPYLEAVVKETMRLSPPLPTGFPHRALLDTTLQSYNIPRNSLVIVNLFALNRDPRHWRDPTCFIPERFLDAEGNLVPSSSTSHMPFGAGPRSCIGESLAKTVIFLFLSRILHQFQFNVAPGYNPLDMKGTMTTVLEPKPFRFQASRR